MPNAKRKIKLTKTLVAELEAQGEEYSVWDTTVEGFHVRVLPSGLKTFYVFYRSKRGKTRRRSLGRFPTVRVEEARDSARADIAAATGESLVGIEMAARRTRKKSDRISTR
ncbi:MAG: DUF4102 domain-containing protein [Alphaproteobacteria bacterium]|nr:DUF4102 domain-containing protein [Alphaproteobacteria bacterium]